jgi:type 2A phosphatase activator TIP41
LGKGLTRNSEFKIETTKDEIPLSRLGRDNPVLKFFEVPMFDDELNDNGMASGAVRFRVMNDCFFGLIRYYLRIDNVAVRIMDTRFFHSFDQNHLLREFQVRENSYTELTNKGFKINSEWSLSHQQADMIYNSLDVVYCIRDKISF